MGPQRIDGCGFESHLESMWKALTRAETDEDPSHGFIRDHAILSVVHVTTDVAGVTVGDEVTVGHGAILHACTIGDRVLVGMGATVLDLAVVESDVVIAAGALVPPRARLAAGFLYVGAPARPARPLRDTDRAMIEMGYRSYVELAARSSEIRPVARKSRRWVPRDALRAS